MTRRDALKTMAGALVAFVLPAPRKQIDLTQFCDRVERYRWDMRRPYCLEDWTYATDSKVCVRVRPALGDVTQDTGKMPPFGQLSWNHARLSGWRCVPRLDPIPAADSDCPKCDGTGYAPGVCCLDCPTCDATGWEWANPGVPGNFATRQCQTCGGDGGIGPPGVPPCAACKGKAVGVLPSLVELGGRYFDAGLYEKVRRLNAEYVHDNWNCVPGQTMLRFVFDGGEGLLMGVRKESAERRIADAKVTGVLL